MEKSIHKRIVKTKTNRLKGMAETNRLKGIISPILPAVTPWSGIFSALNISGSYYDHLYDFKELYKSQKLLASTESAWSNVGEAMTRATQVFNQEFNLVPDFNHLLPFEYIDNYGAEITGEPDR